MVKVKVTEIFADCSNLAALLVFDVRIERFPEPFRLQPQLRIIIPREEYAAFSGKVNLQSYFTAVSCAVAKELYYAHIFEDRPTQIRASLPVRQWGGKQLRSAEAGLRELTEEAGYCKPPFAGVDGTYALRLFAEATFAAKQSERGCLPTGRSGH